MTRPQMSATALPRFLSLHKHVEGPKHLFSMKLKPNTRRAKTVVVLGSAENTALMINTTQTLKKGISLRVAARPDAKSRPGISLLIRNY